MPSTWNSILRPLGVTTVRLCRSILRRGSLLLPGRVAASSSSAMASTSARGSWIGSTPFWKQLLKKIGPKDGAMTQRTPMPIIAHTAPSRLEPQAKLLSATTICAPR